MRSFAWVVTREYGCLVFFPHGLGREKGMFSAKTLDFFFFSSILQLPSLFLHDIHAYDNAFFEI